MAYKEISGGNAVDIKKEENVAYEGVYEGFKGITTKIGKQVIWKFKNKANRFGIYGFTTLNMAMEGVVVGAMCRITYLGTKNMQTKYGMKDVHICKVEVDDEYVAERDIHDDEPWDGQEPGEDIPDNVEVEAF